MSHPFFLPLSATGSGERRSQLGLDLTLSVFARRSFAKFVMSNVATGSGGDRGGGDDGRRGDKKPDPNDRVEGGYRRAKRRRLRRRRRSEELREVLRDRMAQVDAARTQITTLFDHLLERFRQIVAEVCKLRWWS